MPFDTTQGSYVALRKILSERTRQVVIFCGAGLSRSAGLPTWAGLRSELVTNARNQIKNRTENQKRDEALVNAAEIDEDFWSAFRNLKRVLGDTTYVAEIRNSFQKAASANPPTEYCDLWRLPISGMVTLNIDGFSSRSFAEVHGGRTLTDLAGIDCDRHSDLLSAGNVFVLNLHGVLSETKTWIFTAEELENLRRIDAYRILLQSLFTTRTVIFVGVSADDSAISHHLTALKSSGFHGSDHYWITHRSDAASTAWAESHGVRIIYYSTPAGDHSEVSSIVRDIGRFVPKEPDAVPVVPVVTNSTAIPSILPPAEIEKLSAEDIRQALNQEAFRILGSHDPDRESKYAAFWKRYSEAIHRAWSVTSDPPRNIFMGFKVNRPLTKGGFGTIYEGLDNLNLPVAIKVLHNVAKDDHATLQSFRRGVKAMRILSERKVSGMVPYNNAWEIPPCAVMNFVEGPNLQEAIEAGKISTWADRLKVASELIEIIKSAHSVPEAVLHRDIRPANIMLSDLWADESEYSVVVLDFDLSWHRDAVGHSVSLAHSFNGYLAPELATKTKFSSRNALVDSYGIGMTLFFLAARRAPLFGESQYADWQEKLQKEVGALICAEWRSLSNRWARLIFWATKPVQSERWDIGKILAHVVQLRTVLKTPHQNSSAELAAEEILARSDEGAKSYVWNVDKLSGAFEIRTGFCFELKGDESSKEIRLLCEWMNTGDRKFENVRKYIGPAADRVETFLKTGGWWIENKQVATDSIRISALISVPKLRYSGALDKAVTALNGAVESLKLSNA